MTHRESPKHGARLAILMLVACIAACSSQPTLPPVPTDIQIKSVDRIVGPGIDEGLARASQASLPGDPLRLGDDVRRACERLEWGVLGLSDTIPKPDDEAPPTGPGVVRARALVPDGRNVVIVAWPVKPATAGENPKPGRIEVALRVGYFGDRKAEQQYIQRLGQMLAFKPKPKRGWGFTPPPPEEKEEEEEEEEE